MASTVKAKTLRVTVQEDIVLNNTNYGSKNKINIPSVNEVVKRVVTVPVSEVELIAIGSAVASGTFIEGDVRYIRITNLDDTNHIVLTFKDEDNTEFAIKVDAEHSFIYPGDNSGGVVDTMHAGGSALTVSLNDLVNITALADTAACDVEIFVASV